MTRNGKKYDPLLHYARRRRLQLVSVLIFLAGALNFGRAVFRIMEITGGAHAGLGLSIPFGAFAAAAKMIQAVLFLGLGFYGATDPTAPIKRVFHMSIGIRICLATMVLQVFISIHGIYIGENMILRLLSMIVQILLPLLYRSAKIKESVCRRRMLGV